jgi:DNA-binding transcriptional regulator GbsR (MarR family)
MSSILDTVKELVMDDAEQIRRDFAAGWAKVGAAWGVTPSTAGVQGYLLLHGGPLTEAELREALGLSHRATLMALADCESWGLVERSEPRRSGRRGPPGRAWVAVGSHWEWFRRVAASRKERETDPVLPLLEECWRRAKEAGSQDLGDRIGALLAFVREFDRGVGAVVQADSAAIAHLFGVLSRLDDQTLSHLLAALASVPEEDLADAARAVAGMKPQLLRGFIRLAGRPAIARIVASGG